jgi:DNA-binding MarR family transcriptional regulator
MDDPGLNELVRLRQQNIGRLCLRVFRHFNGQAVQKLQARGYTTVTLAHTALMINLDMEGTRIVDLASRAGMSKQAMGRLAEDLEQVGYVARTVDPSDRRAARVTFTPKGVDFMRDAATIMREIETEYARLIGAAAFDKLRSQLSILADCVDETA